MTAKLRSSGDHFWPLLANAVRLRCPVCKRGRVFPGLMRMAAACPACGVAIARESGYFLGSIYVNYGVTVVIAAVLYFGALFGAGASKTIALAAALVFAFLFPFWFWRYARSLWLMLDQYFDPRVPTQAR